MHRLRLPHIVPPVTTSNNFDPLGDDEESTVEDEENEDIARRIQEQHDLEAALEATAVEAGVEPEPANVESGGQQPESEGGEAAASSAGQGERDRTRRRGCRAGAKHVPGRENLAYGKTSEYIIAQLGASTYARFGSHFHLPHIPPKVARKQYQEWFGYVTRHSDRWAFRTDGELLSVDIILQWATILPELWQFLYSINPALLQGIRQPKCRLPEGPGHPFVPLRRVRSAEAKIAPPKTGSDLGSKASSSAAPPRTDRSRSAAPKASTAAQATTGSSHAAGGWRPTLDRGHIPVVLKPRAEVEAKIKSDKPKSEAAGPKAKQAAASGAGTSTPASKPASNSPTTKVTPVANPTSAGPAPLKAGNPSIEVSKTSSSLHLPPPPKGPAPLPPQGPTPEVSPSYTVPSAAAASPPEPDADRHEVTVMHKQDDNLGQAVSQERPDNTGEEEEAGFEEEEEVEEQGAASREAPVSDQDHSSPSAKAAASGAVPVRPVVMTPGPGAFLHRHLTPFRLRRTQWDREHEPSMPIEEARDRVYDLDWSNTPQTEGGQLLPPSSTIQVGPNADVYELDAEDSDNNSDPEARSRRIRNLEGRTEEAGWLTWLDGERPGASQPSHPKPQLVEPASKRVRVVVTADALRGTPPITPPHVRQVIVVPKGKSKSASTADRPRVPIIEPQLSLVVDPVFVPAVSPQPPPSARDVSPPVQAPIAPPIAKSPVVKTPRSRSAPPSMVPVHSSSASPQAPKPPSKARPVRSRSPPTKVKPPPPEARQLSAEAKRRAFEAFEERNRPVRVETDSTGKPLPTGARVPVGAGLTAAAPSDPTPPGDGDDDQGEPSIPRPTGMSPEDLIVYQELLKKL